MRHIKNVYLFNAEISDEVRVDGNIIKRRNSRIPDKAKTRDDLRISFMDDFSGAVHVGLTDCLDALVLDVDTVRGIDRRMTYSIYGRSRHVTVEVL